MSSRIEIPELSLVVLIGVAGSGKTTFARKHFRPTEVVSSDVCRGLVGDDQTDQAVTREAFELLQFLIGKRLALGRLSVVDATSLDRPSRAPLVRIAREHHFLPVAIVLDLPERVCRERSRERPEGALGGAVVRDQRARLRRSLGGLAGEGFRRVWVLAGVEEVEAVRVERVPMWSDRRGDRGPFDIIGDVHGCADELEELLGRLGYEPTREEPADPVWGDRAYGHPAGRKAVLLGDLVDRGPRILDTLRLAHNMVARGSALCVPGNHEAKLLRKLRGRQVRVGHGLERTLAEIEALGPGLREAFTGELAGFLEGLVSHYVLDQGRLVVVHAGLREEMQGRGSRAVREFGLYGETSGETDEFGLPVRHNWAARYRGKAQVVYGHTPVPVPEWLNGTINIDTGAVFGGGLTALRWPERELVSVAARRVYCEPRRPLAGALAGPAAQQLHDRVLDLADVYGKRRVETRLLGGVTIREENAAAALEAMSRWAIDPRWLVYLPPTMSPAATSALPGLLEHPREAFAYFREGGLVRVVCERKHMGSRAIAIVCRDGAAARERFGVEGEAAGRVYTRTGRACFADPALEAAFLERLGAALGAAGLWKELATSWVCLDGEILPWSFKAEELLRSRYAAVGAAAGPALRAALGVLEQASARLGEGEAEGLERLREAWGRRADSVARFVRAYQEHCWTVAGLEDLRFAPFHCLAGEGHVHALRDHPWHLGVLERLCDREPGLLVKTPWRLVDLAEPASEAEATGWWERLTEAGAEGMVVKPVEFLHRGRKGWTQPAVKCRGREYLRIIYGPDYTAPEELARLRNRGLGRKRALALRELALGLEGLERFVAREPLRRVHECVFGVLALESEPVDPRL